VGDALHIVLDVARRWKHAHSRTSSIADIKPGNILITLSGLAKLADMGLAKRTDETSHLTLARQGFGTPYYMPYEQAMNAKYADARSDIYALGATLYHLIVGEVPFSEQFSGRFVDKKGLGTFTPASQLNPDVPHCSGCHPGENVGADTARTATRRPASSSSTRERSNLAAALPMFH